MNVFLLMVALAGPVEAPKPVMLVPPALVTAAVPSVRIAPKGDSAAESAAPEAQLPSGSSVNVAVAKARTLPESSAAQSAEPGECRIGCASQVEDAGMEATKVAASAVESSVDAAADVRTLPGPKSDADCSLVGMYTKKRMLSGPWSASRRLKAARIRGDEEESKRMEAMLDDLLSKAINAEGE